MKICFICQNIYTLGGVQRVLATHVNRLAKNPKYDITLLMPLVGSNKGLFQLDDRINVIDSSKFNQNNLTVYFWKVLKKINTTTHIFDSLKLYGIQSKLILGSREKSNYLDTLAHKYDVVCGVGGWQSLIVSTLANDLEGKTIGWMHATYEAYFMKKNAQCAGFHNYFKFQSKSLREILVLTEEDKEDFDHFLSVDSRVLHNSIDNTVFREQEKNIVREGILYVGRIDFASKGVDYLIDIMKSIVKKFPDIVITILGEGPDEEELSKRIKNNNLQKNFFLVGTKSNVEEYYYNAKVLLVPSRFEAFGLIIVEAMQCGLPVVAFKNKGPNEIMTGRLNELLISKPNVEEFAKKVVCLIENQDFWNQMSLLGKERSKFFSSEKIGEDFEEILSKL